MIAVPDPIGEGFAASLSRPGGNVTGLSNIVTEVSVKHLELLHLAVRSSSAWRSSSIRRTRATRWILEQVQGAAYARGVEGASRSRRAQRARSTPRSPPSPRARAEGVIVAVDAFFDVQREQIIGHTLKNRLPSMFASREMTEAGGLMSYGQDLAQHYRRAAGLRRQDPEGHAARRASHRAADRARVRRQPNRRDALGLTLPPHLNFAPSG